MMKLTDGLTKIPPSKFIEFCTMLNMDELWKDLAKRILSRDKSKFRFSIIDIETLRREKNPAQSMLLAWATDNAKIQDLINLCSQLNHLLCVDFFKEFVIFDETQKSLYSQEMPYDVLVNWTNNFNNENLIGIGGFSNVYKATDNETCKQYAIKRLNPDVDSISLDQLKNELLIVSKCKHKNLMDIVGFSIKGNIICIVYDFALNGSLYYQLFDNGARLNSKRRVKLLNDVANGLAYIHSKNFIHRDVKPANILLDDNFNAKLCDYGFARYINNVSMETVSISVTGTNGYIAPEIEFEGKLSDKTDVYSFGVVMLEMITGLRIMDNDRIEPRLIDHIRITCNSDVNLIKDQRIDDWDLDMIKKLLNLTDECLSERDINRPSMENILQILEQFII